MLASLRSGSAINPEGKVPEHLYYPSEISLTLVVAAVTIELDCVARALARCTAVLAVRLWWTGTGRIRARLFVSHDLSLIKPNFDLMSR
jgi:hypothetical protein